MDKVILGNNEFETLVALSEEEQINGLMYKCWPPPIMIFPFKKAEVHKFWMKDTPSPLDIIFCKEGKIVDICEGEPLSLKYVGPNDKTDLVVEMPLGTVNKYNIKAGDKVDIKYSLSTIAKKFEMELTKI